MANHNIEEGNNTEAQSFAVGNILSKAEAEYKKYIQPLSTNPKEIQTLGQIYKENNPSFKGNVLDLPNEVMEAKLLIQKAGQGEVSFDEAQARATELRRKIHEISVIAEKRAFDASDSLIKGLNTDLGIEPKPSTGELDEQIAKSEAAPVVETVQPETEKKRGLAARLLEGIKSIGAKLKAALTAESTEEDKNAAKQAETAEAKITADLSDDIKLDQTVATAEAQSDDLNIILQNETGESDQRKSGWSARVERAKTAVGKAAERANQLDT